MTEATQELEGAIRDLLLRFLRLPEPPAFELTRGSAPQWDSLKHMEIVFALEDRYEVQFDEAEFAALDSPAAIAAALRKHFAA